VPWVLPGMVAGAEQPSTPRFKWAQTKDQVFLTVMVRDLLRSSVSVSVSSDMTFEFRAENAKKEEYRLTFLLREDVKVDTLKWEASARPEKWGDGTVITVNKVHEHRWDILTSEAKKFKGHIDKDWVRDDPKLEPEEEIPYFDDNSKYLQKITQASLNKTMSRYQTVIANLRFPWCTHCKSQDEAFVKAAKAAKSKGKQDVRWKDIAFGVMDAREERSLARTLGAQCTWTCEYVVFANPDKEPMRMKAKWSDSELLGEVSVYLEPAVRLISSVDSINGLKASNSTCVGSFASNTSKEFLLFSRVANIVRLQGVDVVFAAQFDAKMPTVELWPVRLNTSLAYDGTFADNGTALLDWVKPRALPVLQEYSWQLRETYESLGLPIAKLWLDDKDENPSLDKHVRHVLRKIAKQYLGKLAFVEQKRSSHSYELRDYGLNQPEVYPAFGIAANTSFSAPKYALDVAEVVGKSVQDFWLDGEKAASEIQDFCDKVLAGSWPLAHESGAVHANWTAGEVKRLVWKSWGEIVDPGTPILLEVMGRYRSEHERRDKEVENLARSLQAYSDRVVVASFDTSSNYFDRELLKREKYSSDTEWYWVPLREDGQESSKLRKLGKPRKDAPMKAVVEFFKKQSSIDFDVEEIMTNFEELMVQNPPPSSPVPPSEEHLEESAALGGEQSELGGGEL